MRIVRGVPRRRGEGTEKAAKKCGKGVGVRTEMLRAC